MHTAGCLADPSSRTYCYLTAALAANPFDIFLFSLPLGTHIPKTNSSSSKTFNITPSCSACSKSLMGLFADALRPSKSSSSSGSTLDTSASDLSGLRSTYNEALEVCQSGCGPEFALVGVGVGVSSATKAAARFGVGLGTWAWASSWMWTWFFGTTTALLVWIWSKGLDLDGWFSLWAQKHFLLSKAFSVFGRGFRKFLCPLPSSSLVWGSFRAWVLHLKAYR